MSDADLCAADMLMLELQEGAVIDGRAITSFKNVEEVYQFCLKVVLSWKKDLLARY